MNEPKLNRPSDEEAVELLRRWLGYASPVLLGQGMEGCVYEIDGERVAKVWFTETAEALERVRPFYDALWAKPLGFAVPRVLELVDTGSRRITVEQRLVGTSLVDRVSDGSIPEDAARSRFVDVLTALAESGRLPEGRTLSVMDEITPFYEGSEDFPDALARLATTRRERFADSLNAAVVDLDDKVAALVRRLVEVDTGRRTAVHGDLILANIMVDDGGTPTAVLDWGFFSTEGDPAFEAAIASAIFDMYGDDALSTEISLYELVEERLGYSRDALLVYRAAYSLITANAYAPDGRDGHFAWCAAALNRPDVVRALLG